MSYVRWVPMPSPMASEAGTRLLWIAYAKKYVLGSDIHRDGVVRSINSLEESLRKMQLKCDLCYTAYSLEEIACGSDGTKGCGQKTLRVVQKTVDDELVGRLRIGCGNEDCRKVYYPPRTRVATCKNHPDNSLSYLLVGNDQSEMLPIMCLAVADKDIRSTTEYFQAACGAKSASQALKWLVAQGYMSERRIGVHTKDLNDPFVYTITDSGKAWRDDRMLLFEEHGLHRIFNNFVKFRNHDLRNMDVKQEDAYSFDYFVHNRLKAKDIPAEVRLLLKTERANTGFKKALIKELDSRRFLAKKIFDWLTGESRRCFEADEKYILRKDGVVYSYLLPIPVRKGVDAMELRHVPSQHLATVFGLDRKEVWD